jgi:hypothetical protein
MRVRVGLAVVAGLATVAGITAFVVHRLADDLPIRLPIATSCVVSGSGPAGATGASGAAAPTAGAGGGTDATATATPETDVTVDGTQLANAATITAVGIRRGLPQRAVLVALATAFQESKLENLPNGDRDSIGLFQQRPSYGWGRPDQLSDPRYAANAFYSALLKVKGWDRMRVTDAAQAVQHSAHPEAYEKWSTKANVLADALTGATVSAVTCTVGRRSDERGTAAAEALASNLRLDWGDVRTVAAGDLTGLALAVKTDRAGWQYAHWLVAHAEQHGIKRVRFADREWTARRATWSRAAAPPAATTAAAATVEAEVYPA